MSLVNPMYEVGIIYPVNQKNKKLHTKLNLPIPKGVIFFREFKEGDTLPITFKATGDLFSINTTPQTLTFLKDVYVRATKKDILFSLNQKDWKSFAEIFTGSIDAKVNQDAEGEAMAYVNLVANSILES